MLVFFIVTQKMLEINGMAETGISGRFNYVLKQESFLGPAFFADAGQALNYAKLNGVKENFVICRGIINQQDAMMGLEAVLVGNVIGSLRVVVDEMTRISGA